MDIWFSVKKILSLFLDPVSVTLQLVILGIVLLRLASFRPGGKLGIAKARRRRFIRRTGFFLIFLGSLFLYLASINPVAHGLTLHLERQAALSFDDGGRVRISTPPAYIVVLAGGHRSFPGKPVLSRLTRHGLARVVGAVDHWREYETAQFVVTGHPSETRAMSEIAIRLGVAENQIIQESKSRDTKDHPVFLKPILGDSPFLLITSATHMPRAAGLFRAQGLNPEIAPVDFVVWPAEALYQPYSFVPRASNLFATSIALHEILGLRWASLRGQLAE